MHLLTHQLYCCLRRIRAFFHSDTWRIATVSFFERFCSSYTAAGIHHDVVHPPRAVYRAFRRLIERLIDEQLVPVENAPDLATLALFCELVGTTDLLDDWLDDEVKEQAKLMLLCNDEVRRHTNSCIRGLLEGQLFSWTQGVAHAALTSSLARRAAEFRRPHDRIFCHDHR